MPSGPTSLQTRRLAATALMVAAAAAGVLADVGPADGATSPNLVIRLVSVTTSARYDDKAPEGPSAGDKFISTSRLINDARQLGRAKGAVVGSDSGTLTLTSRRAGRVDVLVRLPGGTLRVRGQVRLAGGTREIYPVTGGTGRFSGARGTLTVTALPGGGERASNVYRLTLAI